MQKGPTPYRQTPPPFRQGAVVDGQTSPRSASKGTPRIGATPYRPGSQSKTKLGQISLKPNINFDAAQDIFGTDKKSAKRMRMLALAFLIFYILIVASKSIFDYRTSQHAARTEHLTYSEAVANNMATEIDNATIWINNGLAEGQTPDQSARIIAKSPVVSAAAILNGDGDIIAIYPRQSPILTGVPIQGAETGNLTLNSIVQSDGQVTPLVIKQTGKYFVVAALADNVLVNERNRALEKTAIVAKSGRLIDASGNSGTLGSRDMFNISETQFSRLTQPGTQTTEITKINGRKHLLSSVAIPGTDLFLLEAKPSPGTSVLQNSLMLFTILFLGTSALIVTLLNSLKNQLRAVQSIQQNTEVSQQRYRAAIEGDRGGVWEVDLAGSSTFVSASLAGLLGLLRKEQTMSLSKFLSLFHPEDRERFLAFARRAHLQGEFDFNIRVAHLPLILQCRGRSSTRSGHELKRVIVGVALDITEQRAAQIRLKTTEARLHNALSSMTDSFVVWDAMNRLVVWNKPF